MLGVITGASSGIGKQIAYKLAQKKYDLILIARREDRLLEIKNDLQDYGVNINVYAYDLSNLSSCKEMINQLKSYEIDLFINNAGFGVYGHSFNNETAREFDMIDLNIKSLQFLTKEIIKIMKKGTIINISSMAAFLPTPFLSSYAATKAYVYSYSQAVRYELKMSNIPINLLTVCPGPVITEFNSVANASPKMKGLSVEKCVNSIIKGMEKNKPLIIPGIKMKLLKFVIRLTPNWLLLKVAYKVQSKK
ncbi:MAG: SDR family oxidoreductase [Candidatus Izemoplasmatales bacterium]